MCKSEILVLIASVSSEGSDESARMHSFAETSLLTYTKYKIDMIKNSDQNLHVHLNSFGQHSLLKETLAYMR